MSIGNIYSVGNNKTNDSKLKAEAEQWVATKQPIGFLENRGQLTDTEGKPVPYILFEADAPGINMYITEHGISYMFVKSEEEHTTSKDYKKSLKEKKRFCSPDNKKEFLRENNERIKVECSRIDMNLQGAIIKKENVFTEDPSDWVNHYYINQSAEGIRSVHSYKKITIKDIYPGIDWVLYNSDSKGFKYDFIVRPGANPKQIKLVYKSENYLNLDKNGNINIKTPLGTLLENAPVCYIDGKKGNIRSKFIKKKAVCFEKKQVASEITFAIDNYDKSKTLVIDPQLVWGTYIYDNTPKPGNGSVGPMSIDCDANGNVYVTGYAAGNVPLMPWGTSYYLIFSGQMFVLRFTNTGVLTWGTYLAAHYGSNNSDNSLNPEYLTIDNAGNIYIVGYTAGNIDAAKPWGTAYFNPAFNPGGGVFATDAFIIRFSNTGTLQWATHLGGNDIDLATSVNIAPNGNIYVTGYTLSSDFPTKSWGTAYFNNATNGVAFDAFVTGFDNAGQLLWSTYLGGSSTDLGLGITTDPSGNIYVSGEADSGDFPTLALGGAYNDPTFNGGGSDGFITKFSNTGQLQWSTYLGGSGQDYMRSIGFGANNNLFVTGTTLSPDFPIQAWGTAYLDATLSGGQDVFIARFNPAGVLTWSTYYGGNNQESERFGFDNIEFDNCGNLYFAFQTRSTDISTYNPCGSLYYDNTYGGGASSSFGFPGDVFITKFSSRTGNLLWATYLGAGGDEFRNALAVDLNNNLFVTGEWQNYTVATASGLPFMNPGGGSYFNNIPFNSTMDEGYIVKFTPDPPPTYTQSQVNSGACICTATATVNINCGIAPFNYIWSNGLQSLTNNSATNTSSSLCPGSYWVEVTDDACNRDTAYYTIIGGIGDITATTTQSNVFCNGGNNGSATVNPTGGNPPYTYQWSNGQTSKIATGLASGSYNVTVNDANGCTHLQVVIITQPSPITINVAGYMEATSCTTNAGSITMTAGGGTGHYAYSWNNNQTGPIASGLTQGIYTVTVTDANACTSTQTAAVTAIPPTTFMLTTVNGICGNGGRASVVASGGTAPYTYAWFNTTQTAASIFGLAAGNYTVTVTDANACTATQAFGITVAPNSAVATFTQAPTGSVCIGTNVTFTNTGTLPTAGVTHNWLISTITSANVSGTSTDFSYVFLVPGTYTVAHTVKDGSCTKSETISITVSTCNGLLIDATGNSFCSGSCATTTSTPMGGTSPYTYSWSTGETTKDISPCPLSTATYTVKVTDSAGLTATTTATVTVNPTVTATTTAGVINCSNGKSQVTATGSSGTSPFTFSWSTGATTTGASSTIPNLPASTYTVTVTDANGCTTTSSVLLTNPPPLIGQFTKGTANCSNCGCKEWLLVNATGGTPPYTYLWPDTYDKRYKNKICPGNYIVKVTDKNGCSVDVNVSTP